MRHARLNSGHEKTISGRERTTAGLKIHLTWYIFIATLLTSLMVSQRALRVVRGEIRDVLRRTQWTISSYLPCGKARGCAYSAFGPSICILIFKPEIIRCFKTNNFNRPVFLILITGYNPFF